MVDYERIKGNCGTERFDKIIRNTVSISSQLPTFHTMQNFACDTKQPESLRAEDTRQRGDYAQFSRGAREGRKYQHGPYGHDEGRSQHCDMEPGDDRLESTKKARSHSQKRLARPEQPVLHDRQRLEAGQPNYVAPASKSSMPYVGQNQNLEQRYRRDNSYGMERPQVHVRDLPGETNFDEPNHSLRGDPKYCEVSVAPHHSSNPPQLYSKYQAVSYFHNESLVIPDQRQNYVDADHQEASQKFHDYHSAFIKVPATQDQMTNRQPQAKTFESGNVNLVATGQSTF